MIKFAMAELPAGIFSNRWKWLFSSYLRSQDELIKLGTLDNKLSKTYFLIKGGKL